MAKGKSKKQQPKRLLTKIRAITTLQSYWISTIYTIILKNFTTINFAQ